jgi:hypothetical protein
MEGSKAVPARTMKLLTFLTSALDGGEWSVSRPGRFIPGQKAHTEEAGIHKSALIQLSDLVYYHLRYKLQADSSM